MAFQRYASQLLSQPAQSTAAGGGRTGEGSLFYSTTYDYAEREEDDLLGASQEDSSLRPVHFAEERRGLATSFTVQLDDDDPPDDRETAARGRTVEYPASRLWENAPVLPSFSRIALPKSLSRGWRTHQSTQLPPPIAQYSPTHSRSSSVSSSHRSSDPGSPPSFLSRPEIASTTHDGNLAGLTEPLIERRTLYVYPSTGRGATREGAVELRKFRNPTWIVVYFLALLAALTLAIREYWTSSSSPSLPNLHTLLPAIPLLALLSILSLLAGLSSLAYLLVVKNAIRHLVAAALIGGPVFLTVIGFIAAIGSFGDDGVERDPRWKFGVRLFAFGCFLAAILLARVAMGRRKTVARTIMVLELASSIILLHPPLFILCLALSLTSTFLTLPFLSLLVKLLSSTPTAAPSYSSTLFVLVLWLWTLSILRGIQRVTVSGVIGSWYFDRHSPSHPTALEITSQSFARATGPSLGSVIASSLLIAIAETIALLARKLRNIVRSERVPLVLRWVGWISPLLGWIVGVLECFNGWVLSWVGLTGDDLGASAKIAWDLVRKNGTIGLVDNLLTKLILNVTSTTLALFSGIIGFFVVSSRIVDTEFAPLVAGLCFAIPFWTIRLCSDVLGDACDALFLSWNIDLDTQASHCAKAAEAFGEPDGESLG